MKQLDIHQALTKLSGWTGKIHSRLPSLNPLPRFGRVGLAPADFATRSSQPSWEEYRLADQDQILARLHGNPASSESEQAFMVGLMLARNARSGRRLAWGLALGVWSLAGTAIILANTQAPTPESEGPLLERRVEAHLDMLKSDYNQKLQAQSLEIQEMLRQQAQTSQGQIDMAKQIRALTKKPTAETVPVHAKQLEHPTPHTTQALSKKH